MGARAVECPRRGRVDLRWAPREPGAGGVVVEWRVFADHDRPRGCRIFNEESRLGLGTPRGALLVRCPQFMPYPTDSLQVRCCRQVLRGCRQTTRIQRPLPSPSRVSRAFGGHIFRQQ